MALFSTYSRPGPGAMIWGKAAEPKATHGQPSCAQGFLPCRQTAIRFFLA